MTTPRVFTYHCAYCSNLFLASTHDFSALPKRKDPGLDHAIIVPLPPPPKSEDESDSSSSEESSSEEEEDEPEERVKPVEAKATKKQEAPMVDRRRGKEGTEVVQPVTPAIPQERMDARPEELPAAQPSEEATEVITTTPAAAPSSSAASMAPPPPPLTTLPSDNSPTATTPTLQTREKDDYTLILSLTKDRTAQIITREDGFEKRWIWRCGRCRIISGYQLDDAHFDPPGSGVSEIVDEKEKKRSDRKRKRYLYILPGAVLPTEELGRELKEKEIDVLGLDIV